MNISSFEIYYEPWPHIIINNFLDNQQCQGIIKEILAQPNFDDKVMVNRNRIFKGSKKELGGTMRLGLYEAKLKKNSLIQKIYRSNSINERHRHRYEVNIDYKDKFEDKGLIFSGMSPDHKLPEIIELKNHPWFVGVQFLVDFV